MTNDIVPRLRQFEAFDNCDQHEIDTLREAADEIERLRTALRYQEARDGRIGTHADGCYAWGPSHYECALREIERLRSSLGAIHWRACAGGLPVAAATAIAEECEHAIPSLCALRKHKELA